MVLIVIMIMITLTYSYTPHIKMELGLAFIDY